MVIIVTDILSDNLICHNQVHLSIWTHSDGYSHISIVDLIELILFLLVVQCMFHPLYRGLTLREQYISRNILCHIKTDLPDSETKFLRFRDSLRALL